MQETNNISEETANNSKEYYKDDISWSNYGKPHMEMNIQKYFINGSTAKEVMEQKDISQNFKESQNCSQDFMLQTKTKDYTDLLNELKYKLAHDNSENLEEHCSSVKPAQLKLKSLESLKENGKTCKQNGRCCNSSSNKREEVQNNYIDNSNKIVCSRLKSRTTNDSSNVSNESSCTCTNNIHNIASIEPSTNGIATEIENTLNNLAKYTKLYSRENQPNANSQELILNPFDFLNSNASLTWSHLLQHNITPFNLNSSFLNYTVLNSAAHTLHHIDSTNKETLKESDLKSQITPPQSPLSSIAVPAASATSVNATSSSPFPCANLTKSSETISHNDMATLEADLAVINNFKRLNNCTALVSNCNTESSSNEKDNNICVNNIGNSSAKFCNGELCENAVDDVAEEENLLASECMEAKSAAAIADVNSTASPKATASSIRTTPTFCQHLATATLENQKNKSLTQNNNGNNKENADEIEKEEKKKQEKNAEKVEEVESEKQNYTQNKYIKEQQNNINEDVKQDEKYFAHLHSNMPATFNAPTTLSFTTPATTFTSSPTTPLQVTTSLPLWCLPTAATTTTVFTPRNSPITEQLLFVRNFHERDLLIREHQLKQHHRLIQECRKKHSKKIKPTNEQGKVGLNQAESGCYNTFDYNSRVSLYSTMTKESMNNFAGNNNSNSITVNSVNNNNNFSQSNNNSRKHLDNGTQNKHGNLDSSSKNVDRQIKKSPTLGMEDDYVEDDDNEDKITADSKYYDVDDVTNKFSYSNVANYTHPASHINWYNISNEICTGSMSHNHANYNSHRSSVDDISFRIRTIDRRWKQQKYNTQSHSNHRNDNFHENNHIINDDVNDVPGFHCGIAENNNEVQNNDDHNESYMSHTPRNSNSLAVGGVNVAHYSNNYAKHSSMCYTKMDSIKGNHIDSQSLRRTPAGNVTTQNDDMTVFVSAFNKLSHHYAIAYTLLNTFLEYIRNLWHCAWKGAP